MARRSTTVNAGTVGSFSMVMERQFARARSPAASYSVPVPLRAFPVLYAADVETLAAFYIALGFEEHVRMPGPDGHAGYIGLRRDAAELAVTAEDSPRMLAGVEPGPGPRHELFVYIEDLDTKMSELRRVGVKVLREPAAMPWGERLGFVTDPEGNVVTLADPTAPV